MNLIGFRYSFNFDDDTMIDKDINLESPHSHAVIGDGDRFLLFNIEAGLSQFVDKSIFVYLFDKPAAEFILDAVGAADDNFSYLVGSLKSVCI